MLSWDPGTKVHEIREIVSIDQTLTMPNFIALGQTVVCEKSVTIFFYNFQYFGALWRPPVEKVYQFWVITYSKASSIKLSSFVPY